MHVPVVRLAKRQNFTGLGGRRLSVIIFGYGLISLITDSRPLIALMPMQSALSSFQMEEVPREIK